MFTIQMERLQTPSRLASRVKFPRKVAGPVPKAIRASSFQRGGPGPLRGGLIEVGYCRGHDRAWQARPIELTRAGKEAVTTCSPEAVKKPALPIGHIDVPFFRDRRDDQLSQQLAIDIVGESHGIVVTLPAGRRAKTPGARHIVGEWRRRRRDKGSSQGAAGRREGVLFEVTEKGRKTPICLRVDTSHQKGASKQKHGDQQYIFCDAPERRCYSCCAHSSPESVSKVN